jgi:lipopolysaccharide/colanic/teichoic acid biosynthesis glycosyltransferase
MWKFRTMLTEVQELLAKDAKLRSTYHSNGYKLPPLDPRVTKVGRWLRASSVDELPQLINVVLGQMSLVGPRPVTSDELVHYNGLSSAYLSMRPGVTGLWQVSGRNMIHYPRRAELDAEYVWNQSFKRDVGILIRTVPAVLRGSH